MKQSHAYQHWILSLASSVTIGGAISSEDLALSQQPQPDETLGIESSAVKLNVEINGIPSVLIEGGAIRGPQKNFLFHSFEEFNVDEGQGAYFDNPRGIQTIFSRVTGNNSTRILGKLGVLGNADLFLINPNGIIFGPHASLDVKSSFLATTASSLIFADRTQFSAKDSFTLPLLIVSVPVGLQFGKTPSPIINQSQARSSGSFSTGLQVQLGKTLALVGGDLTMQGGNLTAPRGRIELGSVANTGFVSLIPVQEGWALGYKDVQNFSDIRLLQRSIISAPSPEIGTESLGSSNIQFQGRHITLADGSRVFATVLSGTQPKGTLKITASDSVELRGTDSRGRPSALVTATVSAGDAGDIIINAKSLLLQDGTFISTESAKLTFLSGEVRPATGRAGDIVINTQQLYVSEGSEILASTSSQGEGGNILINASDAVYLSGFSPNRGNSSGLFTTTEQGAGRSGGAISINTGTLRISDGAVLSASTRSKFRGGDIRVNANNLELTSGGQILTTTFNSGKAGDITVTAKQGITISGRDPTFDARLAQFGRPAVDPANSASGLLANTDVNSIGNGGALGITSGSLSVTNGAQLTANSEGQGNAGDIGVDSRFILLDNQAGILATTASGNGGNITLGVRDLLLLLRNSEISTTAGTLEMAGNGGNITINTPDGFIVAAPSENSDIKANAFLGQGGKVTINAEGIFGLEKRNLEDLQTSLNTEDPTKLDPINLPSSDITAISQTNPSLEGEVTINVPDVDPSQGLLTLPTELVDASGLIASGCEADGGQGQSKLIVTGRGGLPPSPSDPLNSDAVWIDLDSTEQLAENEPVYSEATQLANSTTEPLVEATGWVIDDQGQIVLTTSTPTATPYDRGQTIVKCQLPLANPNWVGISGN